MANSTMANSTQELLDRVEDLENQIARLSTVVAMRTDIDGVWIIISAVLVFFMQVGFAMVSCYPVCWCVALGRVRWCVMGGMYSMFFFKFVV